MVKWNTGGFGGTAVVVVVVGGEVRSLCVGICEWEDTRIFASDDALTELESCGPDLRKIYKGMKLSLYRSLH